MNIFTPTEYDSLFFLRELIVMKVTIIAGKNDIALY